MESIGGQKNKSTSSTIQSNAQSSGKLKIKSKIIDGVVAAVSIQANDNTTINQNLILPESSGSKTETLRIKNDVINNNQELEWYRVPEDSYSDLSYDRDVEFDIDVSNLSLNTGLSFDTDGGDFSNLINNKIGEDNNTAQYVRFNVSSNPQIYPQSFTYTPDPTNDHSLRKVQMWIRKYGSGTETDKTMFPSKFEIHGIPRGGSTSDSVLITTINSPEVNNMNYSASTEYDLNNPVIDESFNPDGLIYDSYEFKIYGNRVDTNNDNYYKPVIGEIKLFGRKVIRNFTNNSIYQLQGISKFETLNVKVVSSSESVNKGGVYKTDLNSSITATNYYTINDITTPNLKFRTGQIYIFNQDNSSNDGHPITFYTDREKTTEYTNTDNIKYIINDTEYETSSDYSGNFGTNRYRRVKILITDDMPGRLYYQCINHSNMGGVIETGTATSSGGGGSTLTVQDEGTDLATAATTLNFEGSGVTATGTGATKTITISGGGSGTSVTANPSLTGEEANLTSLTVGATSYKVGTSINALSYSDTSKLLLSFPFSEASNYNESITNYGSASFTNNTSASAVPTFVSGTGLRFRNPDKLKFVLDTALGNTFTVYMRWNKSGSVVGDSSAYVRLLRATASSESAPKLTVIWDDPDNTVGEPNDIFKTYVTDALGAHYDNNQTKISSTTNDRWYHMFLVVTSTSLKTFMDHDTQGSLTNNWTNNFGASSVVSGIKEFNIGGGQSNYEFDGDIGSFHVFNYAMSLSDAQDWADYVDRNYINQGSPATLDYLANVSSATPSDGQALVYDISSSQWQPGTVGSTLTVQDEGSSLDTAATTLNFVGSGVTASGTGTEKTITISGGGSTTLTGLTDVSDTTTPSTNDVLLYNGTQWTNGFVELLQLLQSVSRIGAGYGPPDGFINENPSNTHIRGSAPALGQSAIYIPTGFQGNCKINGDTITLFDNVSNNIALNPYNNVPPSSSNPYVLEIAIDVPKLVTNYAMYRSSNSSLPHATAWEFQVYNPATSAWVTLDTKTGQSMTSSSTLPSEQTSGFVTDSVSTSILSRLYRFSITGSSGTYIQFGEIGMTFKQPTSLADLSDIANVSTTAPTDGQALVYDTSSSKWQPGTAGTSVVANPTLSGSEANMTSLTVGSTNYKISTPISSLDHVVDVPFLGGIPTNKVSIISEDLSHAASTLYGYTVGGLYDNYLFKSGSPNGSYFIDSGANWNSSATWHWKITMNEAKTVKYVRIWPFQPGSNTTGKLWHLHGSNDGGTTFTLLGSHTITTYPTEPSFSTDTLAYGNEQSSVRLGFEDNHTSYTTYKLEVETYNVIGGRFALREIQLGEQTSLFLSNIEDVSTTAPTDGQPLVWNTSSWQPNSSITADVTGNVTGDVTGTVSDISNHSINGLTDVDTSTVAPEDGQVFAWNNSNSKWSPKDENITEVIEFGLGVVKPGSSFKVDGISGNGMLYYTNASSNGSSFTNPPITVSDNAIDFLLNNDLSNNNEFTFGYQNVAVSNSYPVYLIYDALEQIVLTSYKMWPRTNGKHFSLIWKLEASNDPNFGTFTELDSQDISSSYSESNISSTYTATPLDNTSYGSKVNRYLNKYRYYRLNITSKNTSYNNDEISIGELVFYKKADEPSSLHDGHSLKMNQNGTGLELTETTVITSTDFNYTYSSFSGEENKWQNIASIDLTPGTWLIMAHFASYANYSNASLIRNSICFRENGSDASGSASNLSGVIALQADIDGRSSSFILKKHNVYTVYTTTTNQTIYLSIEVAASYTLRVMGYENITSALGNSRNDHKSEFFAIQL